MVSLNSSSHIPELDLLFIRGSHILCVRVRARVCVRACVFFLNRCPVGCTTCCFHHLGIRICPIDGGVRFSEASLHFHQTVAIIDMALPTPTFTCLFFSMGFNSFSCVRVVGCNISLTEGNEWFTVIKRFWNKYWTLSAVLTDSYECCIT
jgi:hypothetical protein